VLRPDLGDLAALLRKTVFLQETNKRRVRFSTHRLVISRIAVGLENAFELSQEPLRPIASATQAELPRDAYETLLAKRNGSTYYSCR
jgi:hypothetical protein